MLLSHLQAEQYDRDGYLLVENVFSSDEVAALLREVEGGQRVAATTFTMNDATQKAAKLALWSELGNDIWAAASTHPRIVNNARLLLRDDVSFFHGKVMLKEAHSGGAWEWHQDYGYWYDDGFAFPHLISAFVALDAATQENGCLQVLRGSHRLGRLSHGGVGAVGVIKTCVASNSVLRVHCEMPPVGVFFHCNCCTRRRQESDSASRFHRLLQRVSNPLLGGTFAAPPVPSQRDAILQFA
jgi:hypothetical protein